MNETNQIVTVDDRKGALTVKEVARELGCTPKTVRVHIRDGRIPSFRLGRHLRIHRSTVERIINGEDLTQD